MKFRSVSCLTAALYVSFTSFLVAITSAQTESREKLPNFVVIFMDDMAYADIGPFGAEGYETPNLDRMAREGRKMRGLTISLIAASAIETRTNTKIIRRSRFILQLRRCISRRMIRFSGERNRTSFSRRCSANRRMAVVVAGWLSAGMSNPGKRGSAGFVSR